MCAFCARSSPDKKCVDCHLRVCVACSKAPGAWTCVKCHQFAMCFECTEASCADLRLVLMCARCSRVAADQAAAAAVAAAGNTNTPISVSVPNNQRPNTQRERDRLAAIYSSHAATYMAEVLGEAVNVGELSDDD